MISGVISQETSLLCDVLARETFSRDCLLSGDSCFAEHFLAGFKKPISVPIYLKTTPHISHSLQSVMGWPPSPPRLDFRWTGVILLFAGSACDQCCPWL